MVIGGVRWLCGHRQLRCGVATVALRIHNANLGFRMRKVLIALGLTIAVAATGYVASNVSSWAQGCQGTCSGFEARCKRGGNDAAECKAQYKRCMTTGEFKGVKSGTNWTNVCKS